MQVPQEAYTPPELLELLASEARPGWPFAPDTNFAGKRLRFTTGQAPQPTLFGQD